VYGVAVQLYPVPIAVDVDGQDASGPVARHDRAARGDVSSVPRVGDVAHRVPIIARAAERGHRAPRLVPRRRPIAVRVHAAVVVQSLQRVHVALPRRERRRARRGGAVAAHRRVPRFRLVRDDAAGRDEARAKRERGRERDARGAGERRALRRAHVRPRSASRVRRAVGVWRGAASARVSSLNELVRGTEPSGSVRPGRSREKRSP